MRQAISGIRGFAIDDLAMPDVPVQQSAGRRPNASVPVKQPPEKTPRFVSAVSWPQSPTDKVRSIPLHFNLVKYNADQQLADFATAKSPYEAQPEDLKARMKKDFAVKHDQVFAISANGKLYEGPDPMRGVPVDRIDDNSPYCPPGWASLESILSAEEEAQEKKKYYRGQAEKLGVSRTDKKHPLRAGEKRASDDCSKYAKIRDIFGEGSGKYHPNQIVSKNLLPPEGLCEKELLYKMALSISKLRDLHMKNKLAMDPYEFFRWVVCRNLKSSLRQILGKNATSARAVISSMGNEGTRAHGDEVFRTTVLYWAQLTNNSNKFRANAAKTSRPRRKLPDAREGTHVSIAQSGRDLARRLSQLEMRRRRRHQKSRGAPPPPPVYSGVNAMRAAQAKL